jgi:predicted acylesterase/phospholipase RssA
MTSSVLLGMRRGCADIYRFVCATAVENKDTIHIRDYSLPDEFSGDGATIVDAALATSAATTFFEPVTIGSRRYVDGALGANNPVDSVWKEAQNLWCSEDGKLEPLIKCFISLGTGVPGSVAIKDDAKGFLTKSLKEIATETQRTAEKFASRHRGLLDQKRYFRYNVEQGLQTVGLEEYGKQSNIEAATQSYTSSQAQKFKIRDCATNLAAKKCESATRFYISTR